jgi:hypothetical protein
MDHTEGYIRAMKKTYLRVVFRKQTYSIEPVFSIFNGNIKENKAYWKKYHDSEARFFELKEAKS